MRCARLESLKQVYGEECARSYARCVYAWKYEFARQWDDARKCERESKSDSKSKSKRESEKTRARESELQRQARGAPMRTRDFVQMSVRDSERANRTQQERESASVRV